MKSHLGIALAAAAALGCAALLVAGADAQQGDVAPPAPAASVRPPPPPTPRQDARDSGQRRTDRAVRPRFSAEDRSAFFDARLAAVKAGLELTPEQQRLWPAIEAAAHDLVKTMATERQKVAEARRPADPIARLRLRGDTAVAHGEALQKLADAAQPLWASLSADQKRRLPFLMRGMRGRDQARGAGWRQRMRAWMQDRFSRDDDGRRRRDD